MSSSIVQSLTCFRLFYCALEIRNFELFNVPDTQPASTTLIINTDTHKFFYVSKNIHIKPKWGFKQNPLFEIFSSVSSTCWTISFCFLKKALLYVICLITQGLQRTPDLHPPNFHLKFFSTLSETSVTECKCCRLKRLW